MRRLPLVALATAATLLPGVAAAQTTPAVQEGGFALDRLEPSERGSDWFVLDSLDFRGHVRPSLGVVASWGHKPLVVYDANGEEKGSIVENQLYLHVGGALILWERLRVGVNLPIGLAQGGNGATIEGTSYPAPSGPTVGDLRLGADVRLVGQYLTPFSLAVGLAAYMPTGMQNAYAGEGRVRLDPHAIVAGQAAWFAYSARLGFQWRQEEGSFGNAPIGSEFNFAAAAGVRFAKGKALIGPELFGRTVVTDGDVFVSRGTPLEALLGIHVMAVKDLRFGAGAGAGLTRGIGAPQFRAVLNVEYSPTIEEKPTPPPDRDGDGIPDLRDACPLQPGPASKDPAKNGCPPPPDRDGDGIIDAEDACIDTPGIRSQDPKANGCPPPPPDRDGDGVPDATDACIDVAGVPTDDPKTNGCPKVVDQDNDGIPDAEDACPTQAGPKHPDPKRNGCPSVIVEEGQVRIMEQVKFKTGSAVLLPESDAILTAVANVLRDNPRITKVRVEGHTDDRGPAALNRELSLARARSVVKWLIAHGVEAQRLTSAGLGPDKPIDTNTTDEGRQNNRRVEFHIVDTAAAPAGSTPAGQAPATQTPAGQAPAQGSGATPPKP